VLLYKCAFTKRESNSITKIKLSSCDDEVVVEVSVAVSACPQSDVVLLSSSAALLSSVALLLLIAPNGKLNDAVSLYPNRLLLCCAVAW
jgi:hypothetical protein